MALTQKMQQCTSRLQFRGLKGCIGSVRKKHFRGGSGWACGLVVSGEGARIQPHSQAAQAAGICTTNLGATDLNIGATTFLPKTKGNNSPCPGLALSQPQTCARYSAGLLDMVTS